MRLFLGVTDYDWFKLHAGRQAVDEVNFWRPSPDVTFKALQPGEILVWPENPIRRIPRPTKGYISVRNFGICEPASVLETPRIKQETPKSWTRRIPPACQPFMTDTSVAAFMTAWLDRAG